MMTQQTKRQGVSDFIDAQVQISQIPGVQRAKGGSTEVDRAQENDSNVEECDGNCLTTRKGGKRG